jgi:hypothetical protein
MSVSTLSRRIAAAVVGAVVVALLPLAPASAAGDAITYVGIVSGQYLPSGSAHVIGAEASTDDSAESVDLYVDGALEENQVCVPAGTTCSVTFSFDASGLADGTHTTSVRLNTNVGNDVIRDGFTFFVGDAPVASITAPASGGTFTGSVDITVRGVTDPQGTDYPESFTLNNGATTIGTASACASNLKNCSQTITWDVSLVPPGAKSLTVEVTTHDGSTDTSAPALSLAVGADPTVAITIPTQNQSVVPAAGTGAVPVTITAGTDPDLGPVAKSLSLFVDGGGTPVATATCTGAEVPCTKTVTWDATGLASNTTHALVVRVVAGGVTTNTASRTVRIANPPTATITSPTTGSKVLPDGSEVVSFTASGASDPLLLGQQKTLELLIDGAATAADTGTCTSTGACSPGTLTWDASGAAGGSVHTAVVKVTVLGRTATSSSVSFTLADSPVVTVVAPPSGLIKGAAAVTVTAQTDAATNEDPDSVVVTATNTLDTLTFGPISCDSAPVNGACSFTFPWNVSALTGSYTLTAELTTTNGRTRTSTGVVFGIDNPAPTVTLTAPTATVLKGRVTVSMSATIEAPLTGHITTIALFAGGKQLGATKTCAVAATCTISGLWDTTLLANGTTGILAVTTTSNTGAQKFNSPTTTVTLRNPSPSITWISPTTGAVVSGSAVTIKVGLGTDATQSDVPRSAAIYRNGSSTPFDTYLCKATSHACIATFTWNASKVAGLSTFVVKVRTTKDRVRFSSSTAPRKLYASSAARITFLPSTTVDNGGRVTVTGRMVAARTGLGVANAKVVLVRDPAIGSTLTTTLRTNSTGRFTLTYTARSNTTVTARSVSLRTASGKIWMPAGTGVARQQVRAPMTCSAANRTLGPGQKGQGSCSVPGLPFGTTLFLRYLFGGKWTTLASGTSTSTRIPFFYQFPAKGSYQLRVILSGNKAYAGTNSALMPVTVR